MSHSKRMKLASRGKRLGAYCIDKVIPFIAGIVFFTIGSIRVVSGPMNYGFGYGYGYGYGYNRGMSGPMSAALFIMILLLIGYIVAELVFFSKSRTIGKAALGMQVVSSVNGEPIGFWSMLFREWFVKKASSSVFFLGYIWVCIDDKNRGWHDKILDTYVVDLKESEALNRPKEKAAPAAAVSPAPPASVNNADVKTADLKTVDTDAAEAKAAELKTAKADTSDEKTADIKPADMSPEIPGDAVQENPEPAETADTGESDSVSEETDAVSDIEIHAEIAEPVSQIEAGSDEAVANAAEELSRAADACTE